MKLVYQSWDDKEEIKIHKLYNLSVGFTPWQSSYLPILKYSVELFKGRSFKVGWLGGLTLTSCNNYINSYNNQFSRQILMISIKTFDKERDGFKNNFDAYMTLVLEECNIDIQSEQLQCSIPFANSLLNKISSLSNRISLNQYDKYYKDIWLLLQVFWGNKDSKYIQKQNLSEWLEEVTEKNVQSDVHRKRKHIDKVFMLLSGHNIFGAAEMASNNNMPNLSILVSSINSTSRVKYFLRKQIDFWKNVWLGEEIPIEVFRIYIALAGVAYSDKCNICDSLEWKRAFGMILWYVCSPNQNLSTVMKNYEEAFYNFAAKPFPPCNSQRCRYFDIIYQILNLATDQKFAMEKIIIPENHTIYCTDYRMSWIMFQCLVSIKVGTIKQCSRDHIHCYFSNQMEAIGSIKWAVFALLFLDDIRLKAILIKDLLQRQVIKLTSEIEYDLVHKMNLPTNWIEEAKGNRCLLLQRYWEAYQHFKNAGQWPKSHNIAVRLLAPTLLINQEFDKMLMLLSPFKTHALEIPTWKIEGNFILTFLDLWAKFKEFPANNLSSHKSFSIFIRDLREFMNKIQQFPSDDLGLCLIITTISKCSLIMLRKCVEASKPYIANILQMKFENTIMNYDYKMEQYLQHLDSIIKDKLEF